jgi:lactate permease
MPVQTRGFLSSHPVHRDSPPGDDQEATPGLRISRCHLPPALVGGTLSLGLSMFMAQRQLGLAADAPRQDPAVKSPDHRQMLRAFAPYLLLIAVLVVTRLHVLPFRASLNAESPAWHLDLGSLGQFSASLALVLKLDSIFGTSSRGSYNALYVPALIPFVAVVLLSAPVLKINLAMMGEVMTDTTHRLKNPAITLVGALIMVQLMMVGGDKAKTMIIGKGFASSVGGAWPFFAPCLGALGTFFAGSATISNLTFGGIQDSIARSLELDRTSILALQSVGGAMGNMVCVNNITAVESIIGLVNQEGFILNRTIILVLL